MPAVANNRISRYLEPFDIMTFRPNRIKPPRNNSFGGDRFPPDDGFKLIQPQPAPISGKNTGAATTAFLASTFLAVGAYTTDILNVLSDSARKTIQTSLNVLSLVLGTYTATSYLSKTNNTI